MNLALILISYLNVENLSDSCLASYRPSALKSLTSKKRIFGKDRNWSRLRRILLGSWSWSELSVCTYTTTKVLVFEDFKLDHEIPFSLWLSHVKQQMYQNLDTKSSFRGQFQCKQHLHSSEFSTTIYFIFLWKSILSYSSPTKPLFEMSRVICIAWHLEESIAKFFE